MKTRIVLLTFLAAFVCCHYSFAQSKVTVGMTATMQFDPATVTITEGDTVMWVNQSAVQHTTTSGTNCTSNGTWDSGIMNQGETFEFVFNNAGSFPYYCLPHCSQGMTGTVTVNAQPTGITQNFTAGIQLITVKAVAPNPLGSIATIDYELNRPADVTIRLVDLSGKELFSLNEGQLKGHQQIQIPAEKFPSGIYFMQIKADDTIAAVQKLVKL